MLHTLAFLYSCWAFRLGAAPAAHPLQNVYQSLGSPLALLAGHAVAAVVYVSQCLYQHFCVIRLPLHCLPSSLSASPACARLQGLQLCRPACRLQLQVGMNSE